MQVRPRRTAIPVARPWLGPEEAAAAAQALASGWVTNGPRVAAFEAAVAQRVGAAHGVAVSSCTAALHMSLVVLGIGPGDEVVVPSSIATANAVRLAGATPVFADVEPDTLNLSPATVAPVLTPATRAVIVVHRAGVPADVAAIRALCVPRRVAVVEDAARAMGSVLRGRPIGAHSELVAFSFHPHAVMTCGEGGMLMTSRAEWAVRLRRLREHGASTSAADRDESGRAILESYLEPGFDYGMTDVQAAVGLVQLGRLDAILHRRRRLAARYTQALAGDVAVAHDPPGGRSNHESFRVVLPDELRVDRDDVLERLLAEGVGARRGAVAAHLEPAYAGVDHVPLPVTERVAARSLLLPLYHHLTEAEQDRVIAAFRRAVV